jgi:hypothetical protein
MSLEVFPNLALSLRVPGVLADDPNNALPLDHSAFVASRLY